ncbi:MAG: hypothetical protein ACRDRL_15730 [Sciscionella sp.]
MESIRIGNPEPPNFVTPEVRESGSSEVPQSRTTAVPGSGPKYARLVRKDARLRTDQVEALATLRRRASSARSERITENTLIRVAIDLLLAHAEKLDGDTEDGLRTSVTP